MAVLVWSVTVSVTWAWQHGRAAAVAIIFIIALRISWFSYNKIRWHAGSQIMKSNLRRDRISGEIQSRLRFVYNHMLLRLKIKSRVEYGRPSKMLHLRRVLTHRRRVPYRIQLMPSVLMFFGTRKTHRRRVPYRIQLMPSVLMFFGTRCSIPFGWTYSFTPTSDWQFEETL